jgi:TatD DNase family protein
MLVDSHAHSDSERYDEDREQMLVRARAAGVSAVLSIGIGDGPDTMGRAAGLCRQYAGRDDVPQLFASAGVHPHEARFADDAAMQKLEELTRREEVIAVGEIGLDYFYDHSPREQQRLAFARQMEIAAAAKLPILIHCRPSDHSTNAWDETLTMIEEQWSATGLGGVLHCFTGEQSHANRAMDAGFMISFAGNITFAKAENLRKIASEIPAEHLLIETDCPFLAPAPNRGKRNEPAWVAAVATKLAEVRHTTDAAIALQTRDNFYRFFDVTGRVH